MHSFKVLAIAAFAVAQKVVAQSTVLFFTSSPTTVAIGQAVTVTYSAPNLIAPVTIVLRKGDPANLDTIGTLTTTASNGTYTYVPSADLTPGSDYALEIIQGAETNYGHVFTIDAASASAPASSIYPTLPPTASSLPPTINVSPIPIANATSPPYTWPVPTGLGPVPGNGSVVSLTTTPCASGTGLLPGYAGANATFSSPTLSAASVAPTVTSVYVSTAPAVSPPGSATASSGAATGSVTAGAVAPASTGAAAKMAQLGAAFAVALGGVGFAFALL